MRNKYIKIVLFLFFLMPFFESMNGYFLGFGIANIYRFLITGLILVYFIVHKKNYYNEIFNLMILMILFFMITLIQFLFFHKSENFLLLDIKSILRILLCPVYFLFFKILLVNGDFYKSDLEKMIYVYSFLYSILIIVPYIFDLGYFSYDFETNGLTTCISHGEGLGVKGYFIELNSVVAILGACVFFIKHRIVDLYRSQKEAIIEFILYVLLVFTLFLTATKLGILLAIVASIFLCIEIVLSKQITIRKKRRIIIFLISFIFIIWIFLNDLLIGIVNRLDYFYYKNELMGVITSNRFTYLFESLQEIDVSNNTFFINLFGAGYAAPFGQSTVKRSIVEMDWFDFYFSYGIIGFISYIAFFKNAIVSVFYSKSYDMKSILLVFFIYSFIGGHIIVNSMTVTVLAICLSYVYIPDEKDEMRLINDISSF
ncbi:O-antigen ligase family protein [Enterococcus sp. C76]|uniref:O-antigen ligase family protein n=1 Tax=Enterococcus sp. C76 TaxID=3231334 RepID=UPI00349FE0D1